MFESLFRSVLTMSAGASLVILAVLALRIVLRKAPKRFSYILWALVIIRLLCPVFPESGISLMPGDVDMAVVLVDGGSGVQAHTTALFNLTETYGVPALFFVNKTDLASYDRDKLHGQMEQRLTEKLVDITNGTPDAEQLAVLDDAFCERYLMGEAEEAFHARTGTACIPFQATARGWFAKAAAGAPIASDLARAFDTPENRATLAALMEKSAATGYSVQALAVTELAKQPFPVIPITAASNAAQMQDLLQSMALLNG